ncbi:hypothetical protein [Microbacterium lacticum]|uniref:Uncharacterized protein n=1 Tax=Microbacterium lacticum TaxID=33885 RepID=A0A4Y3UQL4_9MICO|nr:hypothetical protein [Microbacterium lacticum]TQM90944.1 hypothetical protein FHX68_2798 [Microbacterium lacticum]GEB95185.1 hypothetical protein MLA01_14040 [Microbacterium lacticum]GGN23138.1 hypothetical protein GCM10009724_16830 [Microbacterium lacticum]
MTDTNREARLERLVEIVIDGDWEGDIAAALEAMDGPSPDVDSYFGVEGGFDLDASAENIADAIREGLEDALGDDDGGDLTDDEVISYASLPNSDDSGFSFWVESD